MPPPLIGPCTPENGKPIPQDHRRFVVVIIVLVMLFTGALLVLGHDVKTALLSAGAVSLIAGDAARRAADLQQGGIAD